MSTVLLFSRKDPEIQATCIFWLHHPPGQPQSYPQDLLHIVGQWAMKPYDKKNVLWKSVWVCKYLLPTVLWPSCLWSQAPQKSGTTEDCNYGKHCLPYVQDKDMRFERNHPILAHIYLGSLPHPLPLLLLTRKWIKVYLFTQQI